MQFFLVAERCDRSIADLVVGRTLTREITDRTVTLQALPRDTIDMKFADVSAQLMLGRAAHLSVVTLSRGAQGIRILSRR